MSCATTNKADTKDNETTIKETNGVERTTAKTNNETSINEYNINAVLGIGVSSHPKFPIPCSNTTGMCCTASIICCLNPRLALPSVTG